MAQPLASPYPVDPQAPYGRDPATGQPMSNKSRKVAGWWQIVVPGIGRLYIGDTRIGIPMLMVNFIGVVTTSVVIGGALVIAVAIWGICDGINILRGQVTDSNGRKLR